MLNSLIEKSTSYYFIKNKGAECYILLFLPHNPYRPLPQNYATVCPNYTSYTRLHGIKKKIFEDLTESNYNPQKFTGNLKALFVELGCAVYLKNNLVALPPFGTRVSLEAIVINGNFEEKTPDIEDYAGLCKTCGVCQSACPVHALDDGFNKDACLRQCMNEYKNTNTDFSPLNGDILGCQHCQNDCLYNAHLKAEEIPSELKNLLKLEFLLEKARNDADSLLALGEYIGNNYVKPHRLEFFALNAIRNKDDVYLALPYLNSSDESLRNMAKAVLNRHNIHN